MHAASKAPTAARRTWRPVVSLLGALALSVASALATSVPAAGQQPQPTAPNQPAASVDAANKRAAQIAAQRQVIATLTEKLQALRTQLKELLAQEPRAPGPNATDEEKKKYNKAHATWQQSVDKVNGSIAAITAQLDAAKKKLAVLEASG